MRLTANGAGGRWQSDRYGKIQLSALSREVVVEARMLTVQIPQTDGDRLPERNKDQGISLLFPPSLPVRDSSQRKTPEHFISDSPRP
jgi:hypothetical protein